MSIRHPHFHAISGGGRVAIDIAKLTVLKGELPVAKIRLVRE
jgi:hypothetical protein